MAEYEFVLPDFLQNCDTDTIHEKMLSMLPEDIDKTEAGFPWDFTRPTALIASELLQFYIPEILKLMFPQWSSGTYLDYLAKLSGIERKSAGYATVTLYITGVPGTVIPSGTVFCTASSGGVASIEFATLTPVTIGSDGTATVMAQAVEPGPGSDVDADTIVLMSNPIDGVESVTNPARATGGTEEESDDELRERILSTNTDSEMSYIGNNADYKRWAESVTGIGTAIVIPEWDGPETVKIVCLDSNGEAANETLLQAVYDYIMRPDDPLERLAPPNVILTVSGPELVEISYSFKVSLELEHDLETVVNNFKEELEEYYKTASTQGSVKYVQVGALLANTQGVADYSDLLMNGSTNNIAVSDEQYPFTLSVDAEEV